jgi:pilus assembly protein Flp/PilA
MLKLLVKLKTNTSGATAIEYGLIAALISVVVIGAFATFGDGLGDVFTAIDGRLNSEAIDDAGD